MIHRYWSGPLPGSEPFIGAAIRALHPQVIDWTDETLPPEVVAWLDDGATKVQSADRLRHRGVMVRWWALSVHGGCWLDHDVLPLRQIDSGSPATAMIGQQRVGCVARFPLGHDLPRMMLDHIDASPPSDRRSPDVGGDRTLSRLCPADVNRLALPHDASGRLMEMPTWGIHLWATSSTIRVHGD